MVKIGKIQAYYVDKHIAEIFNRDPYEAGIIVKTLGTLTQPLKEIFVSKNPFWMLWNIQRDMRAVAKQVPGANLLRSIQYAVKAIPDAYLDVFKNVSSPDVQEMLNNKMLQINRAFGARHLTAEEELERMLQSYNMDKQSKGILNKVWDWLDKPGQFSERLMKIAGYKLMKDLATADGKKLAHIVRTRSGSPDFRRAGHLVQLYNNIFLFSNAGKEGLRASYEAFSENKSGYAWKTAKYDIIPKLMIYAAAIGLLGDWAKRAMDNIPERDKANYNVIPLWITDSGKTVYITAPHSFTGQLMAGSLWYMLNVNKKKNLTNLLDYLAGGVPYSGLNPIFGLMMDIYQYTTGKNPYDSFRGKYVISESRFEAGPWHAENMLSMAKHAANQLGASSIFMRFKYDNLERNRDELQKLIDFPVLGRAIERFLRISSMGKQEIYAETSAEIRKRRARENIEAVNGIINHLNKNPNQISQKHAFALYQKLVLDGKIKSKLFNDFWEQYKGYALMKGDDVFIKAMQTAKSKEEKAALLQQRMKENRR